ncbi:transcription termination/antitermination protein NusG [Spirochaetota bacterium]|nr:transcription termination/antitermination protein NusG [Spirochaetota bacterium]
MTELTSQDYKWFVVHTQTGKEFAAKKSLENRTREENVTGIKEIVVPVYHETVYKNGKKTKIEKKSFPGYICIQMIMDVALKNFVKETPYITNFLVQGTGEPVALSKSEINAIVSKGQEEATEIVSMQIDFDVGQKVLIVDGPFNNFSGTVTAVFPDKGKVNVNIEIFGRETPVEIDYYKVKKN